MNLILHIFESINYFDLQEDISYYAFLFYDFDIRELDKLLFIKKWMLQYKYDNDYWKQYKRNPLYYIEQAIKRTQNNERPINYIIHHKYVHIYLKMKAKIKNII